jgi:4-hydroxybenzoate polyprenyltransferase
MSPGDAAVPLCVDLDGSLTPVDTLHESLLSLARRAPVALLRLPAWLPKGKAAFKQAVAARTQLDVALLPLRGDLLEWIRQERARGRRLVLVTASDRKTAQSIGDQLKLFDEVIASDGAVNLSGERKRAALVARFGEKGFDYVGNEAKDRAVWSSSRRAIVVGDQAVVESAKRVAEVARVFPVGTRPLALWVRAARLHQWVKNVLIFLPALLAHSIFEPGVLFELVLAFISFGLCASSLYVVNDLLDLESDRRHPRKRNRPFASGDLPAQSGLVLASALMAAAIALAAAVGLRFCAVLAGYAVATWAYSLFLKRAAIVDVMTLAGLYTLRIIAGSAATGIPPSFWLLAFSIFLFLSLGVVKRFTELNDARASGAPGGHGRGYSERDLPLLMSLGASSGYCAVIVMALYINSPESHFLYRNAKALWLICPLMLYWISRVWLLTSRGQMHDDPVVFALSDRVSLATLGLTGLVVLVSI